ncbi:Penicillin-binding protein 2D [Ascidiaceihabitans donghaensis]|uniref:peptidoglycan glycosyltransferase n=1 Tax=Ascidiaceihabitans donghaensis TaxID=1510460 RepID=A0A2R8BIA3_9RHOB|nr:PBP1A family penicillin-binding protein [Ascidiaceihabitans donghaensis]SPH22834.1 Penicillin-binding protein 2D [Ascidiaceihabitans donghaensis]
MSDSRKPKKPLVADRRYSKAPKKAAPKKPAPRKTTKRRKAAPKRTGVSGFIVGLFRWVLRLIWLVTSRATIVGLIILALAVGYVFATLPNVNALLDGRARGSVTLLDRDGKVFAWRGDQFGGVVTAQSVSPHLHNAIVATEDKRFYRHIGLSPRGIASAVRINLAAGRGPLSGNGGSTITQQVAKLLCLGEPYDPSSGQTEKQYEAECRRGTLQRKAYEAIYALAMEAKYSKAEILTIYMNRAFLGAGARGFEAASQRYFGKSAANVDPSEAAMLAGLLKAPTRYAPTNDLERSQNRAATILRLMNEQGYLTNAERAVADANPAKLSAAAEARAGGYFADWVMDSGPEFFTRNTTEDVIIRTTFDQRMQKAAEDGLKWIFDNKVRKGSQAQAAIVVMSADGAVRAMVGGRQTKVVGAFNRATTALRQTGSAFKPFVFGAALDLGYSPMDLVDDAPLTLDIPGSGPWSPSNYDRKFRGQVTLTEALKQSLNIPAVKISESVGRDLVRRVAVDFGIGDENLAQGPALALGASESTLIDMTGAYAGILNGGSAVTPYGLVDLRLLGDDAPLMDIAGGIEERVIQVDSAQQLIWMMEKVVSEGTGQRARFGDRQIAGKTGTTQAARDAWFIGFTGDYVAGVWMGYDNNKPLTGVTGGGLPADIWREVMQRVHEGVPPTALPMQAPAAATRPIDPTPQRPRSTEGIINNLLRDILGGRATGSGSSAPSPNAGDR